MPTFDPDNPILVPYASAVPLLRNGDLLQFRSNSLLSYLIKVGSLGCHSHSAMCRVNGGNRIDCLEMLSDVGWARPLLARVEEQSGQVDVFRPDTKRWPELNLEGATNYMRELTGKRYGTQGLLFLAAARVVGLRFLLAKRMRVFDDTRESPHTPFCSHAVCSAYRIGGGVDPVPRKPDWMVVPAELTNSMLFDYVMTLTV